MAAKVKVVAYAAVLIVVLPLLAAWLVRVSSQYTGFDLETHRALWFLITFSLWVSLTIAVTYFASKAGIPFRCFPITIKFGSRAELQQVIRYSIVLIFFEIFLLFLPDFVPINQALRLPPSRYNLLIPHGSVMDFLAVATLVVGIPVIEEIVVRGLILSQLITVFRIWPAIIISTVMWTGMHAEGWIPIFAIGVLNAFATIRTRSLVPAIVAHIGVEFIAVYLSL